MSIRYHLHIELKVLMRNSLMLSKLAISKGLVRGEVVGALKNSMNHKMSV